MKPYSLDTMSLEFKNLFEHFISISISSFFFEHFSTVSISSFHQNS